ncbi:MAG: hypothetical protein E6657_16155, partial [Acinetobacter sp.]|nr:hypothetical protein [Acinetobacter sp.]
PNQKLAISAWKAASTKNTVKQGDAK